MTDIAVTCRCGTVRGVMHDVSPGVGSHIVCYCRDCRAYARHLGDDAALDPSGGTDLFQTSAGRLQLISGADRVACLRMTARGPLRWYAACCNSALGNTAPVAAVPFGGFVTARFGNAAPLGPVIARVFTESATPPPGTPPPKKLGMAQVAIRFVRITLAARIAGDHRRHPFFPDGRPLAPVVRLTPEERAAAYR